MTTWFHTAILATSLVATLAVGIAGAAIYVGDETPVAPKADRLATAGMATSDFMTVETRADGMSILTRVPVQRLASN